MDTMNKSSFLIRYYSLGSLTLLIFLNCANPSDFGEQHTSYRSPENLVNNLSESYNQEDLTNYLSNFTETCQFIHGPNRWGKEQEATIHQRMFAVVRDINLNMQELRIDEDTKSTRQSVYNYMLILTLPMQQILQAQGHILIEFLKDEHNGWQINTIKEMTNALKKNENAQSVGLASEDSLNYFPLQVGNHWTYQEQINQVWSDIKATVVDSTIISGNLYYHIENFPFPFSVYPTLLRVDSLENLKMYVPEDSSELTIYKFNAAVGDTWSFHPLGYDELAVVEFGGRSDFIEVPAGTFADILEFIITDHNSGAVFQDRFARNVGLIWFAGENELWELKSARVNDMFITSVETFYLTWSEIKLSFQ